MRAPFALLISATLLLPLAALAQAPAECSALQQEVETLRAKLLRYEAAAVLPAPASPAVVPAPASAMTPVPSFDTTLPGAAPKPAPKQVLVVEEPYSSTGCREGFLTPMKPAIWQNPDLWLDLEKGMTPAQVEAILGVEHYDGHDGPNVVWGYGKCKASYKAKVMFVNGKLADWNAPRR